MCAWFCHRADGKDKCGITKMNRSPGLSQAKIFIGKAIWKCCVFFHFIFNMYVVVNAAVNRWGRNIGGFLIKLWCLKFLALTWLERWELRRHYKLSWRLIIRFLWVFNTIYLCFIFKSCFEYLGHAFMALVSFVYYLQVALLWRVPSLITSVLCPNQCNGFEAERGSELGKVS